MISKITIDKVFETAVLEEVIGDFIQLKKSGSNYKGLSPFTDEKTPSFMVSPAKQIWKDFSSGKGGNVIAFQVKGGLEGGKQFIDAVQLCSRSSNLGDTRTIVTQPALSTHSKLSEEDRLAVDITDGLIRISVGLEHTEDIINDIKQALDSLL